MKKRVLCIVAGALCAGVLVAGQPLDAVASSHTERPVAGADPMAGQHQSVWAYVLSLFSGRSHKDPPRIPVLR